MTYHLKVIRKHLFILGILVLFSTFFVEVGQAQEPTDSPLTSRPIFQGNYDVTANGVGLYEFISTGDIVLDVSCPVATNIPVIIDARLHWLGRDVVPGDDSQNLLTDPDIEFSVDGGPIVDIEADIVFSNYNAATGSTPRFAHSYIEDVTALILPGTHTYTIADFGFDGGGYNTIRLGAGIQVVYECPSFPLSSVEILEGSDFFIWKVEDPGAVSPLPWKGPYSELYCFNFAAAPQPRDIELDMFIIGNNVLPPETVPMRANDIYWVTGAGAPPTDDIARDPNSNRIQNPSPSSNYAGDEWDTYNNNREGVTITIPASATYFCFQMDSPENTGNGTPGQGMSGFLTNLAFVIPLVQMTPTPTATGTILPTDTPTATPVATDTSTATPVATDTPTATPTGTLLPTDTPVATPTETSTPPGQITLTPSPTGTVTEPPPANTPTPTATRPSNNNDDDDDDGGGRGSSPPPPPPPPPPQPQAVVNITPTPVVVSDFPSVLPNTGNSGGPETSPDRTTLWLMMLLVGGILVYTLTKAFGQRKQNSAAAEHDIINSRRE